MEQLAKKKKANLKRNIIQSGSDGYKPEVVPNVLKVIHSRLEAEYEEELKMMNEQRMDGFKLPEVLYDGGSILVSRENHESTIVWFEKYAGWTRSDQEFRGSTYINKAMEWGVWIYCDDDIVLPEVIESNVRWCFKTPDLKKFHATLSEDGQQVTDIYRGPYGHDYFDFWVTEGVRLTAQGAPDIENRELSNDWVRIGVSDIQKAKEWYSRNIGMSILSENSDEEYVVMGMRGNFQESDEKHPIWILEQLAEGSSVTRKDERKRPYTFVEKTAFLDYHRYLTEQSIPISDVTGNLESLAMFHIYDPDGNRFNIRTFPI